MRNATRILLTFSLGCITISTALTYKCYNCTSMSTGPCGDRFNANDSSVHLVVAMDGQACSVCFVDYICDLSMEDRYYFSLSYFVVNSIGIQRWRVRKSSCNNRSCQ